MRVSTQSYRRKSKSANIFRLIVLLTASGCTVDPSRDCDPRRDDLFAAAKCAFGGYEEHTQEFQARRTKEEEDRRDSLLAALQERQNELGTESTKKGALDSYIETRGELPMVQEEFRIQEEEKRKQREKDSAVLNLLVDMQGDLSIYQDIYSSSSFSGNSFFGNDPIDFLNNLVGVGFKSLELGEGSYRKLGDIGYINLEKDLFTMEVYLGGNRGGDWIYHIDDLSLANKVLHSSDGRSTLYLTEPYIVKETDSYSYMKLATLFGIGDIVLPIPKNDKAAILSIKRKFVSKGVDQLKESFIRETDRYLKR